QTLGNGKQYRYVLVTDVETFPKAYIKKLVHQSHINTLTKLKEVSVEQAKGKAILKGTSTQTRTPTKTAKKKKRVSENSNVYYTRGLPK
ncbi:MAG: hypothetical protein ACKOE6_14975, partial [Flammeovirgaceae bacterium]